MTLSSVNEVEDLTVDTTPPEPTHDPAPPVQRTRPIQILIDVKDALLLRIRSRKLTDRERRKLHEDTANDPEVLRALERTLAAHPQFRRKASGSGISDKHG